MTEYRKHHILPKTYLRYFSKDDSGKGIITLDIASQKKTVEYKNQGDSIFWSKYYYKDSRLEDSLTIEKFFGRKIEPMYNKIIETIKLETEFNDWEVKFQLLQWIIYSQLRSPSYRKDFEVIINNINTINKILPNDSSIFIENILKNIKKYSKEYHLTHFTNKSLFESTIERIVSGLMVKKWKILISPKMTNFWTSDNPGFSIFLDKYEKTKETIPSKYLENFSRNSIHYYPLTKNYCIEFGLYMKNEPKSLNFKSNDIKFERIDKNYCVQLNIWTSLTACNFLIMDESIME